MLSLLELSVTGGVLILVILLVRLAAGNRLPKLVFRLLWALALCRLLIPLKISFPGSVYTAAGLLIPGTGRAGLLVEGEAAAVSGAQEALSPLLVIWLVGMAALALYFLLCHLRSRSGYQVSLPVEHPFIKEWMEKHRLRRPVQVRYSDQIGSPLTYGVLWPVILLPKSRDWEDEQGLSFILAHEMAHIRRFDALTKWLLAAAVCVHWFNPFVWLMYFLANRDLERTCDEAVVRQYGAAARASYALTLVGMEERRSVFAPLESGFSKSALQERINSIMRASPVTVAGIGAALVLTIAVAVVFATSAPNAGVVRKETEAANFEAAADNAVVIQDQEAAMGTAIMENDGTDEINYSSYAQKQYDLLVNALYTEDFRSLPIAEFNRRVNAALSQDDMVLREAYELVTSFVPDSDPMAAFFQNTVRASLNEYDARLQEVYEGSQIDPEFMGTATAMPQREILGKSITTTVYADYLFTYRILDQDGLTVGERDDFLQAVLRSAQQTLEAQAEQGGGEEEFKAALEQSAKAASRKTIEFTGCQVSSVNTEGDY